MPSGLRVCREALEGGCRPVIAICRARPHWADRASELGAQIAEKPPDQTSLASSIRHGLASLDAEPAALLVLLADQPFVDGPLVAEVIEAWRDRRGSIIRTRSGAQRGHPVLFDARHLPALRALRGETGGRSLFERRPDALYELSVADPLRIADFDTPEDLRALLALRRRAGPQC